MVRALFGDSASGPVFVGRRDELALITAMRFEVAKSRGSILLLGGEAGIGKTRLLAHFTAPPVRKRRVPTIHAECLERTQQPLGPLRTFVRELYPFAKSAGPVPAVIMRAVAQLTPEALPADESARFAAVPLEKSDLFDAVTALVILVAKSGTVTLTIEDLQWADPSTLDFIRFLAQRIARARVALGLTYRSEALATAGPLSAAVAGLMREPCVRAVTLRPFSAGEIHEFVGAIAGVQGPAAASLLRAIETRCDGNPFFAEELIKAAFEHSGGLENLTLPHSIRASILQRLGTLEAGDREVLAKAAVLGYRFGPGVLAVVLDRPLDDLVPVLRRLRDSGIIVDERAARAGCRFKHALTREAVYGELMTFEARRLHEQILATLEALGDEDRHLEELAYHAWECRDVERTLRYNERAGAAALAVRAAEEAESCYRRALGVATNEDDRARLLERAASAAQMQGRLDESIATFESAVQIYLARGNVDRATDIFVTILSERYNRGALASAIVRDAEAFLAKHGAAMSTPVRDDILVFAARIAAACYAFDDMRRLLASASDPADLKPGCRQNHYISTMIASAFESDATNWRSAVTHIRAMVPQLSPRTGLMMLYSIAKSGTWLGASQEVELAFESAREIERAWQFSGLITYGDGLRAMYAFAHGRLAEARAHAERALEPSDFFAARANAGEICPILALTLDDPSLATRGVAAVGPLAPDRLDLNTAIVFVGRGAAAALAGNAREAASEMRRALRALTFFTPAMSFAMPTMARHLHEIDLPDLVALMCATTPAPHDASRSATVAMVRSIAAGRLGRLEDAVTFAHTAAEAYAALDWPLFEAAALEEAGLIEEAREIYQRCGALSDIRRLAGKRATDAAPVPSVLTSREREIAGLVASGMTNAAIGERLNISSKTVEKNLSSIFAKLSVRSRSQLAVIIARTAVRA